MAKVTIVEEFLGESSTPLKTLIFGVDGIGKTTLATTLPVSDDSRLVYLGADTGEVTFRKYKKKYRTLKPPNGIWNEEALEAIYNRLVELADDKLIDYIFVDGINIIGQRVLDEQDSTNKQKAYGDMADIFRSWCMRLIEIHGVYKIMIAHSVEMEDEKSKTRKVTTDFPGKQIKNEINRWFDIVMLYTWVEMADGTKQRKLITNPDFDSSFRVKDRAGVLSPLEDPNLGAIFKKIEDSGYTLVDNAPRPVTKKDVDDIPKWAKENNVEPAKFMETLKSLFPDTPIQRLNIDQLNQVKTNLTNKGDN